MNAPTLESPIVGETGIIIFAGLGVSVAWGIPGISSGRPKHASELIKNIITMHENRVFIKGAIFVRVERDSATLVNCSI